MSAPNIADLATALVISTGTGTATVETGKGTLYPAVPFEAIGHPANSLSEVSNSKLVIVTNVTGDVLTYTDDPSFPSSNTIQAGWRISNYVASKHVTNAYKRVNHTGDLPLTSSYPSDDVQGGTDGTTRVLLESYQRANYNSFGEVERIDLKRKDAKGMIAWRIPKAGYNADRSANESQGYQTVTWVGSHFEANDHASNHVHWEVEIPDSTGALQGRLEIPFANATTGVIGLDKTFIKTNLADFVVRTSNSQVLRLSAAAGNHMPIEFTHDSEGASASRRWIIRANSTAESGTNAGTDFQLVRYDDSGTFLDSPIFVQRSSGYVGLGTTAVNARLSLPADTSAAGGVLFGSDTNLYRSSADTLKTDDSLVVSGTLTPTTLNITEWKAKDHGFVSWTSDPVNVSNGTILAAAGVLYLAKLHIPIATTISNAYYYLQTPGATLTSGQCFLGVYQNGTLIASSADLSGSTTPGFASSAGAKTVPLTGSPISVAAGDIYVGVYANGTTLPTLGRNGSFSALNNIGLSSPNLRTASANTGLTTTIPTSLGAQTALNVNFWFAVG